MKTHKSLQRLLFIFVAPFSNAAKTSYSLIYNNQSWRNYEEILIPFRGFCPGNRLFFGDTNTKEWERECKTHHGQEGQRISGSYNIENGISQS